MDSIYRHSYRFNGYRLNVSERNLLQKGEPVSITPKVFDLLTVLVQNSGHLVEKDQLLRDVWNDAFVEEANIARAVHSLRKILGETKREKFIETIPKRGYRFVAKVEKIPLVPGGLEQEEMPDEIAVENSNGFGAQVSQGGTPVYGKPRIYGWMLGIVSGLALFLGIAWLTQSIEISGNSARKTIAVMPFRSIDPKHRDPIYELGITESLILKLSSAKHLQVRPLSAVRKYQGLDSDPTAFGKEQEVDLVLSSNYQILNKQIRVTSQLIDVRSGNIKRTFTIRKSTTDVFTMQDRIASDIGTTFLKQFGTKRKIFKANRGTDNEEAYRLYLQALFIFDQVDKSNFARAVKKLERAIELDPEYGAAHAALAQAYRHVKIPGTKLPAGNLNRSKEMIARALAVNPKLGEAYTVLGEIKSEFENDPKGAEIEYRRGIEYSPNSPFTHSAYANFLMTRERFDEATKEIETAIEIDPGSISNQLVYGLIFYYSHRFDQAIDKFERLIKKNPDFAFGYFWMWLLKDLKGDESGAYEWFIRYQTQIKSPPETIQEYQAAYQRHGWKGILKQQISLDKNNPDLANNPELYYEMACFSTRLGNTAKAFEYLNEAYKQRSPAMKLIRVDPYLTSLHGDPRFEKLIRQVGLN